MQIRLAQPIGFSQPGGRPANEDMLFPDPQEVTEHQPWFMVCDGVGGAARGEMASRLAAQQFDAYFRTHPVLVATPEYIQQALTTVQDQFDAYVQANPSAAGMGTTLTLVYVHEAGLTVAHLGDSRVYLIRNGYIQWRTDDHSYVNELVKGGVLTADQARHHPQRNIITRAIQSDTNRPMADVQLISDVQPGDYFFLCSDGVLERVSDDLLENVLGSADTNRDKMQVLLDCCMDQTRDNFTAYLLQIASVSGSSLPGFTTDLPTYERPASPEAVDVTVVALPHPDSTPVFSAEAIPDYRSTIALTESLPDTPKPVRQRSPFGKIMGSLLLLLVGLGGYVGWKVSGEPDWTIKSTDTLTANLGMPPPARSPERVRPKPVSSLSVPKPADPLPLSAIDSAGEPEKILPTVPDRPITSQRPVVERKVKDGLYVAIADGKRGLLQEDRITWLTPPQFDRIGTFEDGLAKVMLDDQPKYLSIEGDTYDEVGPVHCNRIRVRANDKWGYLNLNGEVAIGIRYAKVSSFRDDCTADIYIGTQRFRIDRVGRDVTTGHGPVTDSNR